jgi:peroxiredoxin
MALVLLLARLLLALVFIMAGLAKLADLAGSRQSLYDFGVPALLANPFGLLLPLAELVVAVGLLLPALAWWGALGALALLLLFVAGIGYNLARGRQPNCHCFGQLHSAPAGWSTLMRNLVLATIAALVVGFGRSTAQLSPLAWLDASTVAQGIELVIGVLLLGLLVLEGWVLLLTMTQHGRLLVRLEAIEDRLAAAGLALLAESATGAASQQAGLPVGAQAPTFDLSNLHGELLTLEALRASDKPVLLLFSDPGCDPCTALLPEVSRWQRDYASKLTLAVISRGSPEANRVKSSEHGIMHVLLQKDREVAESYQASGTPSAVLVRVDGTIGSPLAQGAEAIRGLVVSEMSPPVLRTPPLARTAQGIGNGNGATAAPRQPAGPKRGERAPQFTLADVSGKRLSLADLRGNETLVLFWNPNCGYCQRMLKDLKAWEARPPEGAPQLLVVSTGSVEENKAMGLRAPVLLDQGMSVGKQFGAAGTPMAVLVDAQGMIASELAIGALPVLELAGVKKEPV